MKTCKRGHEREDDQTRCNLCNSYKMKLYRQKNKESILADKKRYNLENKELISTTTKLYRQKNKSTISTKMKAYRRKNKVSLARYERERRRQDPTYRVIGNLRTRLRSVIRGTSKCGSAVRDLGCTREELITYLESLFEPGMTWDNYGNKEDQWSIDHIIPLSKVDLTNREEFLKVNHYTNLRPMWHLDNLKKGNRLV